MDYPLLNLNRDALLTILVLSRSRPRLNGELLCYTGWIITIGFKHYGSGIKIINPFMNKDAAVG